MTISEIIRRMEKVVDFGYHKKDLTVKNLLSELLPSIEADRSGPAEIQGLPELNTASVKTADTFNKIHRHCLDKYDIII